MRMSAPMLAAATCALALSVVDGCICGAPPSDALASCVEGEQPSDTNVAIPPSISSSLSGPVVTDDGFVPALSDCEARAHSITIDAGAPTGRVRFSWESPDTDLDVAFADGDLTVDDILPRSFGGGSSFVISDANGLALGVDTTGFQGAAGDVTIQQGAWRGSGVTMCGTYSTTNARVTVGDDVTEIEVGDEKDVEVDGATVTVHAFYSSHLEEWHCTDSQDSLVWSLARH